jgi:dTMP kinase
LSYELIEETVNLTVNGLMPSITFLLDLDPREGLRRHGIEDQMNLFGDSERIGGNNYLDFESLDFHDRVRSGYLEMAAQDQDRWMVLDANLSPSELTRLSFERMALYLRSK